MNESTLDMLLELVKTDCPSDKSWSVAVRTYAMAQRIELANNPSINREELHQLAYEKVKQYYETKP